MIAVAEAPDRLTPDQIAAALDQWDGLIWQVAYYWQRQNPHLDPEDLYAEARLGFLQACHRFEPSRGLEVATYAKHWAVQKCRLFVRREAAGGLHVPGHHGFTRVFVGSIDSPAPQLPGNTFWHDAKGQHALIPDRPHAPDPFDPPADFWDALGAGALDDRERLVIRLRFRDDLSLGEVGERLGLSKERVRQIQLRALAKLRDDPAARRLADALPAG